MAEIELERKSGGMGWLWWTVGLLLLVVVVWWIWPDDEDALAETDQLGDPVAEETAFDDPGMQQPGMGEPVAGMPSVTFGEILGNPDMYVGQTFSRPEVTVPEVPTDRGFWIEDQGERLFAIIIDEPQEEPKDINPGSTLRVEEGTLRDQAYLPDLEGDPLDQSTRDIVEQEELFLVVDESNLTILEPGRM